MPVIPRKLNPKKPECSEWARLPKRRCQITSETESKPTNKQSPELYEAKDAVESGAYLQADMSTLHIYQSTLKIPLAQEFEKGCESAGPNRQRLLSKVDKAISKKKMKRLALLRKVATGVVITVVGGIILFFWKQNYQNKTDATNQTIKSQPPQSGDSAPSRPPNTIEVCASHYSDRNPYAANLLG